VKYVGPWVWQRNMAKVKPSLQNLQYRTLPQKPQEFRFLSVSSLISAKSQY